MFKAKAAKDDFYPPFDNGSAATLSKLTTLSNYKSSLYSSTPGENDSLDSVDSIRDATSALKTKPKRAVPQAPLLKVKLDAVDKPPIPSKVTPEKSQNGPSLHRVVKQKTLHERLSCNYGDDISMPIETDIDSELITNDLQHPHHPIRANSKTERFKSALENDKDMNPTFSQSSTSPGFSETSNNISPPSTISSTAIFIPKESESNALVTNPYRHRLIESMKKCSDTLVQTLEQVMQVAKANQGFFHSRGRELYEKILNDLPTLNDIIKKFAIDLQHLLEEPEKEQQISRLLQHVLDKYSLFHQYIQHLQRSMYAWKNSEPEEGSLTSFNVIYKDGQLPLSAALQLIPPWLATVLEHAKSILLYTSENHLDKERLTAVVQSFIQKYRNDSESSTSPGSENELSDSVPYHPRLLKHSLLIELTDSKQRQLRVVFLFEDVLICCKPRIAPITLTTSSPSLPAPTHSVGQGVIATTANTLFPISRISQALTNRSGKYDTKEYYVNDPPSVLVNNLPLQEESGSLSSSPNNARSQISESTSPWYYIQQFDVKWFIPTVALIVYTSQYVETSDERIKREKVADGYKLKIQDAKREVKELEKKFLNLPKDQLPFMWKSSIYKSREKLMKLRAELVKIPPHVHFIVGQDNKPQKHLLMSSDEEVLQWSTAIDQLQRLRRHHRYASQGNLSSISSNSSKEEFLSISSTDSGMRERTFSVLDSTAVHTPPVLNKAMLQRRLNAYRNTLALNNIGHYLLENEEGMSGCLETKVHYVDNLTQVADYTVTILVDSHGHLQKTTTIVPSLKTMRPTWDEVYEVELDNSACILFCLYARYPDCDTFVYVSRLELQLREDALQDYVCRLHTVPFASSSQESPVEPLLFCISLRYISPKTLLSRRPSVIKNTLFNVSLTKVLKWDTRHNVQEGNVPFLVRACLADIEKRGLREEGIYRQSGPQDDRLKLKILFEKEASLSTIDLSRFDVHSITGFVKYFFRELPEPLFMAANYPQIVAITGMDDLQEKCLRIKTMVNNLTQPNKDVLRYFFDHLLKVLEHECDNRMNESSLATILAGTLITPSSVSSVELMERSKPLVSFLQTVLQLHNEHLLFSD